MLNNNFDLQFFYTGVSSQALPYRYLVKLNNQQIIK